MSVSAAEHPTPPPAVVLTRPVQMSCPDGHQSRVEVPVIVRAGHHGSDPRRVRCRACGAMVLLDEPLLILDSAPIGAIFVPAEHTTVEDDGVDGARLIQSAREILNDSVIDADRRLTSAPSRLLPVLVGRSVAIDAVAPRSVELPPELASHTDDYREWLGAIRLDTGVAELADSVAAVLAADRWVDVLAACHAHPELGSSVLAPLVGRVVEVAQAGADSEVRAAVEPRVAFLRDWQARGGDPGELVLGHAHGLRTRVTLGVQALMDQWFLAVDDASLDGIALLERALDLHRHTEEPDPSVTLALRAGLASALYRRRRTGDIATARVLLAEALPDARRLHGPDSVELLRLQADRAVLTLDDPDSQGEDPLAALIDIQRQAAAALPAEHPFQAVACLNAGTAWLEQRAPASREFAQEEGITWLEQALQTPGLSSEVDVLACANLAAVLRDRLAPRPSDQRRASELTERAVSAAEALHRPSDPERLVGALSAAANAATEAGRHDQAVRTSQHALAIAAETMAREHPTRLRAQANGASILHNRAAAVRTADPAGCDRDRTDALVLMNDTAALMADTHHPMHSMVQSNIAALLADPDSSGQPLDADGAERHFQELLTGLDPVADAEVLVTVALNAGTFWLGRGNPGLAQDTLRTGWRAANALADRAVLLTAQQTGQGAVARAARRLAVSLVDGSDPAYDEAFDVLDASRARLIGNTMQRTRAAQAGPQLDAVAHKRIAAARRALDHQLAAERDTQATTDPALRRQRARTLQREIEEALSSLPDTPEQPHTAPAIPVVHVCADELATVVAIRLPDGSTIGFATTEVTARHLAALAQLDSGPLRRALARLLPVIGAHIGERLTAELLGRGYRDAIIVPGGAAAGVPWNAVPLRGDEQTVMGTLTDVVGLRLAPAARLLTSSAAPPRPTSPWWLFDKQLTAGRWELAQTVLAQHTNRATAETPGALWPQTTDWLHISVHGDTDAEDPLIARLRLPGGSLSITELLTARRLPLGATVIAPACRAAQVASPNFDEVLSVAHAFTAAGAETVIAGLWDLPDLATAIIIARMYAHLEIDALWRTPDIALRSAQRWVRDQTHDQLAAEAAEQRRAPTWLPAPLAALLELRLLADHEPRPFSDPLEWAGLITISTRSD